MTPDDLDTCLDILLARDFALDLGTRDTMRAPCTYSEADKLCTCRDCYSFVFETNDNSEE